MAETAKIFLAIDLGSPAAMFRDQPRFKMFPGEAIDAWSACRFPALRAGRRRPPPEGLISVARPRRLRPETRAEKGGGNRARTQALKYSSRRTMFRLRNSAGPS
jgi:hypothetical protein